RPLLRLVVGAVGAADLGALVPVDAEPAEAVEDRLEGLGDVALLVGVVDAEDEPAAVAAGEEPVEQGRPHAADVQVARRAGGEPGPNRVSHEVPTRAWGEEPSRPQIREAAGPGKGEPPLAGPPGAAAGSHAALLESPAAGGYHRYVGGTTSPLPAERRCGP